LHVAEAGLQRQPELSRRKRRWCSSVCGTRQAASASPMHQKRMRGRGHLACT